LPFAPLEDQAATTNPKLADIDGLPPATVAILENAGYHRLDDIIDLEREDFLKLAGIMIEDAERLVSIIDELTMDGPDEDAVAASTAVGAAGDAGADAREDGGPMGAGEGDQTAKQEGEQSEPAPESPTAP
jgi:N utilization substance protein A